MKKYTIHNEQSSPSDEAIKKQQNFGKLFGEYEKITKRPKKPIYKDPKYLLFIALIILIAFIVFDVFEEDKKVGSPLNEDTIENPSRQLTK